jgi:hypothetical protein
VRFQGRKLSILLLIIGFISQTARAARQGKVDSDQAQVYEKPDQASSVVQTLKKDDSVSASNFPVQGFHKVRTASGKIGWVKLEDLVLRPVPVGARAPAAEGSPSPETPSSKPAHRLYLRGSMGLNLFNATGVVGGFDNLKNGVSYGGEAVLMLSKRVGLVLRLDSITKSIILEDSGTSKNYLLDLNAMPVMGGFTFAWLESGRLSSRISGLAGTTLKLGLQSSIIGDSASAATQLNSSAVNFLGKLDFQVELTSYLAIFGEGGYRYLKSPVLTLPSTTAATSAVLNSSFALNLSGPFVGGGIALQF